MKKTFMLILLVACGINYLNAQNIYYDAKILKEHLKDGVFQTAHIPNPKEDSLTKVEVLLNARLEKFRVDKTRDSITSTVAKLKAVGDAKEVIAGQKDDVLFSIFKKYFPEIKVNDASPAITDVITKNPFFETYSVQGSVRGGGNPFNELNFSDVSQKLGGINVTKFANAVSEIMIDRAKQELTIGFFNRFKKFSDTNPEFQILFPKTTTNLNSLLTYTYPQMLPALRGSFLEDLKLVTFNLDDVLALTKYRDLLRNLPEITVAIKSLKLIQQLETGDLNAADLIKEFRKISEGTPVGSPHLENIKSTLKFAAIFSESLRSANPGEIWLAASDVKLLVSDDILTQIFMGLMYQVIRNEDIKFYFDAKGTPDSLTKIIFPQAKDLLVYQKKISDFINLTDKIKLSIAQITAKPNVTRSDEDVFNYMSSSLNIVDYSLNVVKVFEARLVPDSYLTIVKKASSLYKNASNNKYTQTVNDAVDFLTSVHELANNNSNAATYSKDLDKLVGFASKVKPYALFMANVAEAKDGEEIKAALENAILPVGSSTIKKNTGGNLSVQSYLGAFFVGNPSSSAAGSWKDEFGVTAPIGISLTPGFASLGKGGAFSIFTSLLDLGAIVDYKLKKEPDVTSADPNATTIQKDYEINLGQIFSPGYYVVFGLPWNLPLSLALGRQYGPGLSKIDSNNNIVVKNPSWRTNLFFSVDIPLFTLSNRVKPKVNKRKI